MIQESGTTENAKPQVSRSNVTFKEPEVETTDGEELRNLEEQPGYPEGNSEKDSSDSKPLLLDCTAQRLDQVFSRSMDDDETQRLKHIHDPFAKTGKEKKHSRTEYWKDLCLILSYLFVVLGFSLSISFGLREKIEESLENSGEG